MLSNYDDDDRYFVSFQYAPENTLEAFKQAIAIPHVIGIESDVSYRWVPQGEGHQ